MLHDIFIYFISSNLSSAIDKSSRNLYFSLEAIISIRDELFDSLGER